MKYAGKNEESLEVIEINSENCDILKTSQKSKLILLWFTSDNNRLKIDAIDYTFNRNDMVSLTEFHKVQVKELHEVKLLRWNRSFYCILDHDSEVSCKGILYYGASNLPVIKPQPDDVEVLQTVWKMLLIEMQSKDNLQLEMLQMMLKRLLILCTRIYKIQNNYSTHKSNSVDIIREYNFLVEKHFREKHSVTAYATLLNKSPKTLSNLFKKIGSHTPLQFIQNRIMLEARRLLKYTDKTISEIGYELGFSDVQVFSRFFKNLEGISPSEYKENKVKGNIANLLGKSV